MWTPTAIELFTNRTFIRKRIEEQKAYIATKWRPKTKRDRQLRDSAYYQLNLYNKQLKQLTK